VLPNGDFSPCCDFRLDRSVATWAPDFPRTYRDALFRATVRDVVGCCEGCMYGSYPEMSIAMRFMAAKLQRVRTFFTAPPVKDNWPVSYDELLDIARSIRAEPRVRPALERRKPIAVRGIDG